MVERWPDKVKLGGSSLGGDTFFLNEREGTSISSKMKVKPGTREVLKM